ASYQALRTARHTLHSVCTTSPHHPDQHSFPTRRSSDLDAQLVEGLDEAETRRSNTDGADQAGLVGKDLISRRRYIIGTGRPHIGDRKSTRLNSSHVKISYAVFCLKKKKTTETQNKTQQE